MKVSTILAGLTVAATTAIAVAPASADIIDRRQANQAKRIDQGIRSGELTRAEAARLKAQQAYIRELERKAERDGRVTRAEKARIQAAQNAASRSIYAEKHDAQKRRTFANRWNNNWNRWNLFQFSERTQKKLFYESWRSHP